MNRMENRKQKQENGKKKRESPRRFEEVKWYRGPLLIKHWTTLVKKALYWSNPFISLKCVKGILWSIKDLINEANHDASIGNFTILNKTYNNSYAC